MYIWTGAIYPSYWTTFDKNVPVIIFALSLWVILALLNFYWFYKMVSGALKVLKKR